LQHLAHTEGAVVLDNDGKYRHEYHLKDHLGNIRVTYNDKDGIDADNDGVLDGDGLVEIDNATGLNEIKQINHYYPFGLNMEGNWNGVGGQNKYQYNGKEWNDKEFGDAGGLGWNDYGARFYDPAVSRWLATDPLSESFSNFSPYHYGNNNPIRFIDPNGMQGEDWVKNKKSGGLEWKDNVKGKGDVSESDPYTYFGAAGTEYQSADGRFIRLGSNGNWSVADQSLESREADAAQWTKDFKDQIKDRQPWFDVSIAYAGTAATMLVPGGGSVGVSFGRASAALKNANKLMPKVAGKSYVYRALTAADAERFAAGIGLEGKAIDGLWSLEEHLIKGSSAKAWLNSPWISTSLDLNIARSFSSGNGIVRIQLSKIAPAAIEKGWMSLPRSSAGYNYSIWQQEVTIFKNIPQSAMKLIK
jgi:RHS repeat-associated protein